MEYRMGIYSLSDREIAEDIGKKLKEMRLKKNMTRAELGSASGIHEKTIGDAENGKNITMITLISMLRGLSALNLLDSLIEEEGISPAALFRDKGRVRRRATGSRGSNGQ